jgi:hypothetical protein
MPKLTHSLPKYCRHRASGQAVVDLGGVYHYLGPHGSRVSKREYDRLIAEWLQQDRRTASAEAETLTVTILCARYLRFANGYYRKDGKATIVPAIKCSIKYLRVWYGSTPAADFGPLAFKTIRQKMVEDGLSRRYINDHCGRIKRVFKMWAHGAARAGLHLPGGRARRRIEARP